MTFKSALHILCTVIYDLGYAPRHLNIYHQMLNRLSFTLIFCKISGNSGQLETPEIILKPSWKKPKNKNRTIKEQIMKITSAKENISLRFPLTNTSLCHLKVKGKWDLEAPPHQKKKKSQMFWYLVYCGTGPGPITPTYEIPLWTFLPRCLKWESSFIP